MKKGTISRAVIVLGVLLFIGIGWALMSSLSSINSQKGENDSLSSSPVSLYESPIPPGRISNTPGGVNQGYGPLNQEFLSALYELFARGASPSEIKEYIRSELQLDERGVESLYRYFANRLPYIEHGTEKPKVPQPNRGIPSGSTVIPAAALPTIQVTSGAPAPVNNAALIEEIFSAMVGVAAESLSQGKTVRIKKGDGANDWLDLTTNPSEEDLKKALWYIIGKIRNPISMAGLTESDKGTIAGLLEIKEGTTPMSPDHLYLRIAARVQQGASALSAVLPEKLHTPLVNLVTDESVFYQQIQNVFEERENIFKEIGVITHLYHDKSLAKLRGSRQ
jgi:hypothetical protein